MNKTIPTLRYLIKSYLPAIGLGCLAILSTVAVTDIVYFITAQRYPPTYQVVSLTVPFEATAGLFAALIGLAQFVISFKVGLANGVSRKSFHLANLVAAVLVAAVFSLFSWIVILVHGIFWPINSISHLAYQHLDGGNFLALQFTIYLLWIVAGRLINLAFYRSSTWMRWALSLTPFVLAIFLAITDLHTDGKVFYAINEYLVWSRAYPRTLFLTLAYAAALLGLTHLLLRRAPLKN